MHSEQQVLPCAVMCCKLYCPTAQRKIGLFSEEAVSISILGLAQSRQHYCTLQNTEKYIQPWEDKLCIYLLNAGYVYRTVNHSAEFLAPDMTHTNTIEGF